MVSQAADAARMAGKSLNYLHVANLLRARPKNRSFIRSLGRAEIQVAVNRLILRRGKLAAKLLLNAGKGNIYDLR